MSTLNHGYPGGTNDGDTPASTYPDSPTARDRDPTRRWIEYDANPPPQVYYPPVPASTAAVPFTAPPLGVPPAPAPEVIAPFGPPLVPNGQAKEGDGTDGSNDGDEEKKKKPWSWVAELWNRAKEGRFSKHKLAMLVIGILFVLAVTISAPITASSKHADMDRSGDHGHGHDHDEEPSATETLHSPASSTSSSPKTTRTVVRGCEREVMYQDVEWVGILGGANWEYELATAGSAAKCCARCYMYGRQCNAWLHVPSKRAVPDCTIVHGYEGEDADRECPNGKPAVVFKEGRYVEGRAAGVGPCAAD